MAKKITRRNALAGLAATSGSLVTAPFSYASSSSTFMEIKPWKGNINHSVCYWCFNAIPFEQFAQEVKKMGLVGIDLVVPEKWPILNKYGLQCTMAEGAEISLTEGWNDTQYHSTLIKNYKIHIELCAAAGIKNLICFSGNRRGMDDETGLVNCVKGLQQVLPHAERNGVTLHMELFNSKIDHPDYMCDSTPWGIELCERLGSPNFKLLYDIYHMQISEGDIIRTIRDHHRFFGHYHTAGVPGRNEINTTQELFYPAVMKALLETGYTGVVAQEFIPKNPNPLAALREGVAICDV